MVDNRFANDHAVAERHNPFSGFEPGIDHEAGHQPRVQGADVADRVPDFIRPGRAVRISSRMDAMS